MRKLSESVWGDIRKKSLGQEVRTETPIGDYSFDQFYKYLKDNYVLDRDDRIKIGRDNTGRHITATIFIQNKNRVELTIGENPSYETCLDIIRTQPFEENVERRIRVFTDLIRVEFNRTKIEIGHETKYLIDRHKGRHESRNSIYLRVLEMIIIGLTLQTKNPSILCIKRQEGKEFLGESVWGDIRKKSLGQEERMEDDVNHLDRDGFYKYLMDHYRTVGIKQSIGYGDHYLNIPLFVLNPSYRETNCGMLWDFENNRVQIAGNFSIWPQPIKNLLKGRYKMRTEFFSKRSEVKLFTRREGETNNDFLLEVIDAILSKAEYPVLEKI